MTSATVAAGSPRRSSPAASPSREACGDRIAGERLHLLLESARDRRIFGCRGRRRPDQRHGLRVLRDRREVAHPVQDVCAGRPRPLQLDGGRDDVSLQQAVRDQGALGPIPPVDRLLRHAGRRRDTIDRQPVVAAVRQFFARRGEHGGAGGFAAWASCGHGAILSGGGADRKPSGAPRRRCYLQNGAGNEHVEFLERVRVVLVRVALRDGALVLGLGPDADPAATGVEDLAARCPAASSVQSQTTIGGTCSTGPGPFLARSHISSVI